MWLEAGEIVGEANAQEPTLGGVEALDAEAVCLEIVFEFFDGGVAKALEEVAHGVGAGEALDAQQGVESLVRSEPIGVGEADLPSGERGLAVPHRPFMLSGRWEATTRQRPGPRECGNRQGRPELGRAR